MANVLRKVSFTLALALAALVVHVVPPSAGAVFQLERTAMAAGQWWRIITCHITHWSMDHFVWDVVTFSVLSAACELRSRQKCLVAILGSTMAIPLTVLVLQPQLQTYRGLSGVDSALFGLLAFDMLREKLAKADRRAVVAIVLLIIGLLVKTLIETATGAALFADSTAGGFVPVPVAHLVGFAAGAMAALVSSRRESAGRQHAYTPLRLSPL